MMHYRALVAVNSRAGITACVRDLSSVSFAFYMYIPVSY